MPINFNSKPGIIFGAGKLDILGDELNKNKRERALIVTDSGLKAVGHPERVKNILLKNNIKAEVYADVRSNPDRESVEGLLRLANDFSPEVFIAVGGGSVLDTAKAAGIWYTNQQEDLFDLENPEKRKEVMAPVINVPTTAGTGSEVSSWAVITDHDIPEKISIGGEKMAPSLAIVDPEMTLSLPPKLTLWTGLDAFTHALEAYISKNANSYIEDISLLSLQKIARFLPAAVEEGSDIQARTGVMLGSMIAGLAMENAGLGLIHGISHQISAFYDYPHGLTNAVLLPAVLQYNYQGCKNKIDKFLALEGYEGDIKSFINDFYQSINFEEELGIKTEDIPEITEKAINNINTRSNPVIPDREDIKDILLRSFKKNFELE